MRATTTIIIICVVVFIVISSYPQHKQDQIFENYAFSGDNLMKGRLWVIVTSLFLHGNLTHLLFNMAALFFFGRSLEKDISEKKFLTIFFLGGIVGNLVSLAFYPSHELFIGASGAIFAIMGMVMLADPFELTFYPYLVPVPIVLVGVIYIIYTILAFLFGGNPEVAYTAHLGGLAVGVTFGLRKATIKGILTIVILFAILLAMPILFKLLGALDYSQLIGALF